MPGLGTVVSAGKEDARAPVVLPHFVITITSSSTTFGEFHPSPRIDRAQRHSRTWARQQTRHRGDHRFVRRYSLITIPDNIDSKYRFVILSALRARQIQGGSMPLLKEPRHKSTQIAQKEILQGLVKFRIPERNGAQPAVAEEQEG